MGNLTADITRLVGEIEGLRRGRRWLITGLKRESKDLEEAVSAMRSRFQNEHQQAARETKAERLLFVSGLTKTVASLLQEFGSDLRGAHRAWYGPSPKERKAIEVEKKRRLEAEQQSKLATERVQSESKIKIKKEEKQEAAPASKSFNFLKPEKNTTNRNRIKQ